MKRILTATALIVAVVALIFLNHQLWLICVAACVVALLAVVEYTRLANLTLQHTNPESVDVLPEEHRRRTGIPLWWMLLGTVLLFLATFSWPLQTHLPVFSGLAFLLLTWTGLRAPIERVLPVTSAGVLGLIYAAYPLTLLGQLWMQEEGPALLLFLMVCVWTGDIAALYVGRRFGKHKLAPRLSPGKTIEGAIASIAGSMLAATALVLAGDALTARGNLVLHIGQPLWQSILLAAILNCAAQLGDLLESAIKRGAGVKDSGTLLPGHGGILDRIDALLLAAPVLWYALLLRDWLKLGAF